MSTTFVTAIYSRLEDGSVGRWDRYAYSLKNLVQSTDAQFVVFTSPEEVDQLKTFIAREKMNYQRVFIVARDLSKNRWHDRFCRLKELYPHNQRSMDLVHNKVAWLYEAATIEPLGRWSNVFWIDAGLSFSGLFPERFRRKPFDAYPPVFERYTDLDVFTPTWAKSLGVGLNGKLLTLGLSVKNHLWTQPLDLKFYNEIGVTMYRRYHVIGGLFGAANLEQVKWLYSEYDKMLNEVLDLYEKRETYLSTLPVEELLLTALVANNPDRFDLRMFDTWYHEDHGDSFNSLKNGKPFYKLFTDR